MPTISAFPEVYIDLDDDLDEETIEGLWEVVAIGSMPVATTPDGINQDDSTWKIIPDREATPEKFRTEVATIRDIVRNMVGDRAKFRVEGD